MAQAVQSFRDLDAWKLGIALTKGIYRFTGGFPDSERFGLVSQLRRAAVSIPSNIAEGWGRGTRTDYARFLRMARGSLFEVETQLVIARELGYGSDEECESIASEADRVGRVVQGLIKSIERKV